MIQIPRWKIWTVIVICLAGFVFTSPNLIDRTNFPSLPEWLRPVNLGLDLQGGSQILLEVDVKEGLKDYLHSVVDATRSALRKERVGYTGLGLKGDGVAFHLRDLDQKDQALNVLRKELSEMDATISQDGAVSLTFKESTIDDRKKMMLQQSIEIINRRVNEFGTAEPNIQQQGDDRVLVQLPGVQDPSGLRALLGKTAKMTFRLVHEDSPQLIAAGKIPPGTERLPSAEEGRSEAYIVNKQVFLTGENLVDAQPGFDQYNRPDVGFKFDASGGRKFGDITRQNVGRQLAIVLDGKVISAPVIQTPIPGGQGTITGNFTVKETNNLAILMRAGALPAPLTVIEERTVGPDLGADSIDAGKSATVWAILLVAGFMLLAYSFFGIVANIALCMNIVLLFAAMSAIQATLTLPGIAGIALTMGMAVDANVLIFERIKEELRNGHRVLAAIDSGYTRAMGTIVDSNLTTLIGAAIMFSFGSGPIRGFAVTLALGILISMFTAITLTRVIVSYWFHWRRPQKLSI